MRPTVGETELSFKQPVVEEMNRIIAARGLAFDRVDVEQSIPMGKHKKFADAVLWKRRGQEAVCEIELKRPFIDAADAELVNDAAAKANAIGARYFVTWNVRDLILWETFVPGKPLLERRAKWWSDIVDVADVGDLRDHHWVRIREFLVELLDTLDGLYNKGKQLDLLPIDEFFVRKLSSVVSANYHVYSTVIRKQCDAAKDYYAELRKWANEHGWLALLQPDIRKTDPLAFEVLGRLAVFMLTTRVVFYDLVRSQHPALPKMTFKGLRSGKSSSPSCESTSTRYSKSTSRRSSGPMSSTGWPSQTQVSRSSNDSSWT